MSGNNADRSELDDAESRIEALEQRIEELDEGNESSQNTGVAAYALGTSIAVVLSWSRSGSILWCMLHGLLSWVYVLYFVFTR